jgi:hypothetical protein
MRISTADLRRAGFHVMVANKTEDCTVDDDLVITVYAMSHGSPAALETVVDAAIKSEVFRSACLEDLCESIGAYAVLEAISVQDKVRK